ncbi:MAG: aminoacyl-tRNA hydrolase [Chloroflexota bacterium]
MSFFQKKQTVLIAGLGNPGRAYRQTRHNIGFMLMDHLAGEMDFTFSRMQHKALIAAGRFQGHKIILAKPQTFMNNSGQAVGALMRFYKLSLENMLIVCDDVDLPFETMRLRPSGGSAGQKGMKSIIQHLGNQEFPRLRLGIGRPPGRMETADYVLQKFAAKDSEILDIYLRRAGDAVIRFITDGIEDAMTSFNRTP